MPYTAKQSSSSRLIGLVATVLIQAGIVYALVTGLASKVVEVVKGPVETKIIEEIKDDTPPPPPPPPPPPQTVRPPDFVPPVEVNIDTPPPPNPAPVSTTKPPVVVPPTAPVAPAAPPAPPSTPVKLDQASFSRYQPEYPSASSRLGEEGRVVFQVYCDANGRVTDAKVAESSGHERLDEAVVKQAQRGVWKCTAETQDGKALATWSSTKMAYRFQLKDAR
ncbi:energy transducer TonB [Nitrospirillum amazonense]|uniref:energy transducer TonB n=1 Tax=Nitrospirillum amazonense TaxID=28077 RepID=UPI0024126353|nr:energy transducer TonB [Nitrospirillum amazonense]MDG3442301.1 energy transducer TonB [Nitrospirillum amazonense]MEC4593052.1 energy transducer TonB [Nitrospirillum amazonense]